MNFKEAFDDSHNLINIKFAVPNKPYYCRCCNAKAFACAKTSTEISPYFRGKHVPGYECAEKSTLQLEHYYGFNMNEFYDYLHLLQTSPSKSQSHKNSESSINRIYKFRSVSTLYKCCFAHALNDKINNEQTIGNICVDDRNVDRHWKGFSGLKLFSGIISCFKRDENFFIVTCKSTDKKHFLNAIIRNDETVFNEIIEKIAVANSKIAGTKLAIFSDWYAEDNLFYEWYGKYICNISTSVNSVKCYAIIK